MKNKEIPVLLLTGYLGSGKTTLVNKILSNERGIKFAVIVNDIGEVNIDADLIQKGGIVDQKDDSLVALQNGCICCTLKMDLVKQLNDIVNMKKFDYIVIEASGICEPAPIAQTICSIPTMGPQFIKNGIVRLDSIVTVVDALRMKDEFGNGADLIKQNIGEEDIENLVIQQIEFCNIIECNYGDVALEKIINTRKFDFNEVATSAAWIDEIEHHHGDEHMDEEEEEHEHNHHDHDHDEHHDHEHEHKEGHHHHHHHDHEGGEVEEYGIGTFVYYRRKPFDLVGFDEFIATQWPKTVIRCKGICWFKDEPQTCYVFEQAGRQMGLRNAGQWYATMPEKELKELMAREEGLRRDWNETYGDRMQKLVFIGQHLDKEEITRLLDARLVD